MKRGHWSMCAVIAQTDYMISEGKRRWAQQLGKCIDRHVGYTGCPFSDSTVVLLDVVQHLVLGPTRTISQLHCSTYVLTHQNIHKRVPRFF